LPKERTHEYNGIVYEKILERKIIVNYYNSFKKIDKHLLNNILNGIILKGAIDL